MDLVSNLSYIIAYWFTLSHWRNFTLESGGDQWRRQDLVSGGHDDRGAEGAEWGGVWRGVSAPQPTRGSAGAFSGRDN